jgi:hypothetical protein
MRRFPWTRDCAGLERFHFREDFPPLLVQFEQFVNLRLVPCPARGETLADKIGLFADQFDVEHGAIIETKPPTASWKLFRSLKSD